MDDTRATFVIVGAGLAGAKAAEALRSEGFGGRVVLVGEESERPCDRPPMSKDYLQGKSERGKIDVHPTAFRGDVDTGEYIAFWLRERRVLAAMNVNLWDQSDALAALVRSPDRVDVARLTDPDVALEDVTQTHTTERATR